MSGSLYDPALFRLMQTNPELAAIERRRMLAAMLMKQGQQNQKITHPLQIAGNLANTAVGALMARKADEESKALTDQWRADDDKHWQRVLQQPAQSATPDATPAGPMTAPPPGPVQRENVPPLAGSTISVPEHLRPIIQQASEQSGVPFNIIAAKLQQETGFRPDARGTSGEVGISQILPSTAAQPGYGLPPISAADAGDPTKAIPWGAQYLAARAKDKGVTDWGDPAQAARGLAAYNGSGPAADGYGRQVAGLAGLSSGQTLPKPQETLPGAPSSAPGQSPGGDNMPIPGLPGYTLGTLTAAVMEGMQSKNPFTYARAEKYMPMLTQLRQQQALALQEARAERGPIPQGYRFNRETNQLEQIPGAPTTSGLQPIYGYNKDNQLVVMFPDGRGGVTLAQVPADVTVAPPTRDQNLGTTIVTVGPGGRPLASAPVDVAGKASAGERGKAEGTEIAGAENAYRTATQTLQNIDGVLNHPAIRSGTGMSSVFNAIPGSDGYDFALRVDQLKGQAFLQAFNALKGGGAITEAEGAKATAAIARLNTRLGTADFKAAVQELRDHGAGAQERAKAKMPAPAAAPSGAPQGAPVAAPPAAAAPGTAPARVRRWNPETGELE